MSFPKTIVGSPVTTLSRKDYEEESNFFQTGGAQWNSTTKAKERVGERFMFISMQDDLVEFFEIEHKSPGFSEGRVHRNQNYTAVLTLSKKIGQMSCRLYAELGNYKFNLYAPFIRSTMNCRWNVDLEEELTGKKYKREKTESKGGKAEYRGGKAEYRGGKAEYKEESFTEKTNWDKKSGWVYAIIEIPHLYERELAENDIRTVKIGITTVDLTGRRRQLNTGNPRDLYVDRSIKCSDPKKVEKYLHDTFGELKCRGEWYFLTLIEMRSLYDFVNDLKPEVTEGKKMKNVTKI
jgi:hypothetical protein